MNVDSILFTHKNCWDGAAVAAVFIAAGGNESNIHYFQYWDKNIIPNTIGRDVFIVDFSFSREEMDEVKNKSRSLIVLDHHESSRKTLKGFENYRFDLEKCGSVLLWEYLYPRVPVPPVLMVVDAGDRWVKTHPLFECWNVYRRTQSRQVTNWINCINKLINMNEDELTEELTSVSEVDGKIYAGMISEITNYNKIIYIETKSGDKIPAVFSPASLSSEVGHELAGTTPLQCGCVLAYNNEGRLILSFRSTNGSAIKYAEEFGGGGHPNAAGASVDVIHHNEYLRYEKL